MEKDYNNISLLEKAREIFGRKLSNETSKELFKEGFNRWWTASHNQNTGEVVLFRYMTLDERQIKEIINGKDLLPHGAIVQGSLEGVIKKIESKATWKAERMDDVLKAFRKCEKGENISEFICRHAEFSGGGNEYDLAQYLTTFNIRNGKLGWSFFKARQYQITVNLDKNKVFRTGNIDGEGELIGVFDNELEWTYLGIIPNKSITEIYDIPNKKTIMLR
ncbi:MAG: hypothetical protein PHW96_01720 [Candidatus Nanoarchaeia archaeon]|nr:hypothetical protein [Candidatus Nanoarchaeia archaeon]